MRLILPGFVIAAVALCGAAFAQTPVAIVAAENFYGEVAQDIGGSQTTVMSILSNPNQDPHLFEADPATARSVSRADVAVENGAGYDPWMSQLLQASPRVGRTVLTVADLVGRKPGDNPHLWYDPATMPALARALAAELARRDAANAGVYRQRLDAFIASLAPLHARIAAMKAAYSGTAVTATEPVFGYMAGALGLEMRNTRFQIAIMNDTEPSASDMAAFERDLRSRAVKALLYNSQVTDDTTSRLLKIATDSGVPVVGVTETMPAGKTYVQWMLDQLDALAAALGPGRQ